MIKKRVFRKICSLSISILKNRHTLSNLSNPFLFIVSGHPFFLSRYKNINSKKINFLFYVNYFLKILLNLTQIFFYFFKTFFRKDLNNIKGISNFNYIIISHAINKKNFERNIDTQFGGIEKKFPKKKTIFFYLNHNKLRTLDLSKKFSANYNFILNDDLIDFKIYKKIIFQIFCEFYFLIKKIFNTKDNFNKKFYINCSQYTLSLSTVKNMILFYNLEKLILKNKIKSIFITLEGHPFEFLVFLLKKKYQINVFAYQHALVTTSHFSMFLDISKYLSPTKILTNGEVSYNFLKKKINKRKIIILGSNKYKKRIVFNSQDKLKCLILPAGFESETLDLLKLSYEYLKNENNKIDFILRLNPHINKKSFIEKYKNLLKNIKISNSIKLEKDISSCKFVLYRGSTAVVEAIQQGLIPIYYYDKNNRIQIDPLWQLKSKFVVKNQEELKSILKKNNVTNKYKINSYINFANKFYTPLNLKILRSIL